MQPIHKRARTDDQKRWRRAEILRAAEQLFEEVGYEAFAMARLGKSAGVVKGTLYLYFKTREEVFLALYDQALTRWSYALAENLGVGLDRSTYAKGFFEAATQEKSLIPLLGRLEKVIEHNVSIERLIDSKRNFIECLERVADATVTVLNLPADQAMDLVKTLGVLLVGVSAADLAPDLKEEALPPEVRAFIDSFDSKTLFIKNAQRIIQAQCAEANTGESPA
ncbi:MAG: TetR/AcrR family transcriptional regulator [Pseudomonadales bacterium]|jgi:AcrR family transcriptional regulator